MKSTNTTTALSGTILGETSKAIHFHIEAIDGEPVEVSSPNQWFPFSQVQKILHGHVTGEPDELVVSKWIMIQKELI